MSNEEMEKIANEYLQEVQEQEDQIKDLFDFFTYGETRHEVKL